MGDRVKWSTTVLPVANGRGNWFWTSFLQFLSVGAKIADLSFSARVYFSFFFVFENLIFFSIFSRVEIISIVLE